MIVSRETRRRGMRSEIRRAILVPLDGSELARELRAPLVVLDASHAPTLAIFEGSIADGRAYVSGLVEQVRRAGVDARGEVIVGAPAAVILARAEQLNPAAVVMATHG